MTRNRALRAIEELVDLKELAVLLAADRWSETSTVRTEGPECAGPAANQLCAAVDELRDARALLALATGDATAKGSG